MPQSKEKNMVIVCRDEEYLQSIEYHLLKALHHEIKLSVLTGRDSLETFNQSPKDIDILLVESELYEEIAGRQNCKQVFILTEQENSEQQRDGNVRWIYKYSSVRSMIDSFSQSLSNGKRSVGSNGTKIISVFSPSGGSGKTTVSLGLAAQLGKKGYKTLYVSTDMLQDYQQILGESLYMADHIGYQCSLQPQQAVEELLAHSRSREFVYFPAWKRALPSYGIDTPHLLQLVTFLQKKNLFDYIVVDLTQELQQEKLNFLNQSDRVVIVTRQDRLSAYRLQKFLTAMTEWKGQAVLVHNFYDRNRTDYLENYHVGDMVTICEQIETVQQESVLAQMQEWHSLEKTAVAVL